MSKCVIVAEMSVNHSGDKTIAIETIKAAKRAGADAVKMQTYIADTITQYFDKPDFIINEGYIYGMVVLFMISTRRLIHLGSSMKSYLKLLRKKVLCVSLLLLIRLRLIRDLAECFGVKSGLSEHTIGVIVLVLAVANGAVMIEKHFILNKNVESEDSSFSMDEDKFRDMVQKARLAEAAMGKVDYTLTEKMKNSRTACRSLYVAGDVKAGEVIQKRTFAV